MKLTASEKECDVLSLAACVDGKVLGFPNEGESLVLISASEGCYTFDFRDWFENGSQTGSGGGISHCCGELTLVSNIDGRVLGKEATYLRVVEVDIENRILILDEENGLQKTIEKITKEETGAEPSGGEE